MSQESQISQQDPAKRLKEAAEEAKQIIGGLDATDKDALIEATLFQAIAAGDVIAAAITTKLRLQRENLRLRQRLQKLKIKVEAQRLRALEAMNKPKATPAEIQNAILEIYGLPPHR